MTRIALYGSSLFLSAIAAAIKDHGAIQTIAFPEPMDADQIIQQRASAVLWRSQGICPDLDRLSKAGVWLLEVDEQQSVVTIAHGVGKASKRFSVRAAGDLVRLLRGLEG